MTVLLDTARLITGRMVLSNYRGLGVPFDEIPTTGENGGSPLLNDGGVSGDQVRWELTGQSGLTVKEFNENGSARTQGVGSYTYNSYRNGALVGNYTVTVNAAASDIPAGSGSDTLTATTSAIGYRQSSGSGSDTATLTITAFGLSPSETPTGFGSDTLTVAISAVGYRQSSGSSSDTATLTAAALGYRQSRGAGSDTLTLSIGGVTLSRAVVITYNTSSERYAVTTASQGVVING